MLQELGLPVDERLTQAIVLIATRLGAFAIVAPPLASIHVPATVRVSLVLVLSTMLALCVPAARLPELLELRQLPVAACAELAIGLAMALGVALAFAAFTAGAQILDLQAGFGMAQVLDPQTRQRMPVLASAFSQLAVVSFFATDGHLSLIRAFAVSLERFPPGHALSMQAAAQTIVAQGGSVFILGFAMVAPVVFLLFIVDLAIGVVARNLPQMNMFALGVPIKVAACVAGLAMWLPHATAALARTHASMFTSLTNLLR